MDAKNDLFGLDENGDWIVNPSPEAIEKFNQDFGAQLGEMLKGELGDSETLVIGSVLDVISKIDWLRLIARNIFPR